jgi:hypothetical protein
LEPFESVGIAALGQRRDVVDLLELSNLCGYSVEPQLRHVGQPPPPGRTVKLFVLPAYPTRRVRWCVTLM